MLALEPCHVIHEDSGGIQKDTAETSPDPASFNFWHSSLLSFFACADSCTMYTAAPRVGAVAATAQTLLRTGTPESPRAQTCDLTATQRDSEVRDLAVPCRGVPCFHLS